MRKALIVILLVWVVLVGTSFCWNYKNAEKEQKRATLQTARDYFKLIVLMRDWNAGHGGVYVPVTPRTQPNPYLEDLLRDIETDDGRTLTRVNPAFMTRQLSEIVAKDQGILFSITSLNPISPKNRPDPWEEKALQAFEDGTTEVGEYVQTGPSISFNYMAPLITKQSCLQCHAGQGYKVGDIRGGISVVLPDAKPFMMFPLATSYLAIGLLGAAIIVFFSTKLSSAYQTIQQQAETDALTEMPNRRFFFENLARELKRCRRDSRQLALIMGDIDYFKNFNDTYGHKAGDDCLKKIARVIRDSSSRPGDFCSRFGGEEFVVVLPDTDLKGALYVAEKLRQNIEDLDIPHIGSLEHKVVTISLGVSSNPCSDNITYETLIDQADEALYRAKANGRNRVESQTQTVRL